VNSKKVGVLLLMLAAAACSEAPPIDRSWHEEGGYRWQLLQHPSGGDPGLHELTASTTGPRVLRRPAMASGLTMGAFVAGAALLALARWFTLAHLSSFPSPIER